MPRGKTAALVALAVPAMLACASGQRSLRFASASALPDEPRRAPGVAVDPVPRLPDPVTEAGTDQGVAVLGTPPDAEQAREIVRRYFRSLVDEKPEALGELVATEALAKSSSGEPQDRVQSLFMARVSRYDYRALRGQPLYRESELETYRYQDFDTLPGRRRPPIAGVTGDVVVHVRMAVTRSGRDRLLGDDVWFVLRPFPEGYRIVETLEDFQLQ